MTIPKVVILSFDYHEEKQQKTMDYFFFSHLEVIRFPFVPLRSERRKYEVQ